MSVRLDKVVFACVHNAGRSQMASAFFNSMADRARAHSVSAGTNPGARVHPVVVEVMREVGIDLESAEPQILTTALVHDASLLVTMGCGDACPYVPGLETTDWPLTDPAGRPLHEARGIRDEIRARVGELLRSRDWSPARPI